MYIIIILSIHGSEKKTETLETKCISPLIKPDILTVEKGAVNVKLG